jgi:hypothetical protein
MGFALVAGLAPAMGNLLFDADLWDWRIYSVIAFTLFLAGLAASLIPALQTLRYD